MQTITAANVKAGQTFTYDGNEWSATHDAKELKLPNFHNNEVRRHMVAIRTSRGGAELFGGKVTLEISADAPVIVSA